MAGDVGGGCGMPCGSGGETCDFIFRVPCCGVRGKRSKTCLTHGYLSSNPCTSGLNRFFRTIVFGIFFFEIRKDTFRAVCCPYRQSFLIGSAGEIFYLLLKNVIFCFGHGVNLLLFIFRDSIFRFKLWHFFTIAQKIKTYGTL